MNGFDLLQRDKRLLVTNNLFSVDCILSNGTDTQDDLKCVSNYIGITNTSSGNNNMNATSIINDSAEAALNIDDVKIGRPETNWIISFAPRNKGKMIDFRIDYVMEDRTIGIYKLSLSLISINKENNKNIKHENNLNKNAAIQYRRNGGI